MLISRCSSIALAIALDTYGLASAQALQEQVWGVFAYTLYGDSIPNALPLPRALTPYGASGLYTAGSVFRERYVAIHSNDGSPSTRIPSLSPYVLEAEQVNIFSTPDQPVVASAQAFTQGLYPPLDQTYDGTFFDPSFQLANGSLASAPLNGYQYPQIITLGLADPGSLTVAGQVECNMHQAAISEYISGSEAQQISQDSEAFYGRLYDEALSGVFDRSAANYANAYYISEYLEYQNLHNETFFNDVGQQDIELARWYADNYVFATNGNTSAGSNETVAIRTIAGRTLASSVIEAFDTNIQGQGVESKLTLLFGSYEPAVALASLLQLASLKQENFYSRPNPGASLVFELYSYENGSYPTYPDDPSQLYVRFLLRNGTDSIDYFQSYPLFGNGPSNDAIPYNEFQAGLEQSLVVSTKQWCDECNSAIMFCSGVSQENSQDTATANSSKGIRPAVAGVIGAVITVVFLALIAIIVFLIFGVRMNHIRKSSSLGGFKGSRKMASDSDITFKNPTWENGKTANNQDPSNNGIGGAVVSGHERSGSWEMAEPKEENNANPIGAQVTGSPLNDEDDDVWRTHSVLEPVRVRESI